MATNKDQYRVLIKKNVLLKENIKNQDGTLIPLDKVTFQTAAADPQDVVILDREEVAKLVASIQESAFDIKYFVEATDIKNFPDAQTLNTLYRGSGVYVQDIVSGEAILLKDKPDLSNTTIVERRALDQDGILFSETTTGAYEIAGFIQDK